jgi:hypothetical protein
MLTCPDGMTPETFGTSIRGTACGTSAALSRLYVPMSLLPVVLMKQYRCRCTSIGWLFISYLAKSASFHVGGDIRAHSWV